MTNINFTENVSHETLNYWKLNRPDRMTTFMQNAINEEYLDNLPLFWKTFRELWTDSEFTHEIKDLLFMIISEHWKMEVVADSHNCCEGKNEREQYMTLTNQDKVREKKMILGCLGHWMKAGQNGLVKDSTSLKSFLSKLTDQTCIEAMRFYCLGG